MKHTFNRLLLSAAIGALTTLPVLAQTPGFVDSTGIRPWQGVVRLQGGTESINSGGSGATIVAANIGCVNFTNASSTTAVTVSAQSVVGFSPRQIYINGQQISNISIADAGAQGAVTVIVPPLATFTSNHDTCTYTAMANNITAQSLGIRFVAGTVYTPTYNDPLDYCSNGTIAAYMQYGFNTYYYNYGAPAVGGNFGQYISNSCPYEPSN